MTLAKLILELNLFQSLLLQRSIATVQRTIISFVTLLISAAERLEKRQILTLTHGISENNHVIKTWFAMCLFNVTQTVKLDSTMVHIYP